MCSTNATLVKEVTPTLARLLTMPAQQIGSEWMERQPLQTPSWKALVQRYMDQSSKKLNGQQLERIDNVKQRENPLFLPSLLGELRMLGFFEVRCGCSDVD